MCVRMSSLFSHRGYFEIGTSIYDPAPTVAFRCEFRAPRNAVDGETLGGRPATPPPKIPIMLRSGNFISLFHVVNYVMYIRKVV